MNKQLEVQVRERNKGFEVVVVTPKHVLNLLEERIPEGYTEIVWNTIRQRSFQHLQSWLAEEEQGFGVFVYEGRYYEFDRQNRMFVKNWSEPTRRAFDWFRRCVQPVLSN
jgi:hypothetical protein